MHTDDLTMVLHDLAYAVAEDGTATHRAELEYLADEVRAHAPGSAAALTDWSGAEVTRLRAFGVVHAVLAERSRADQLEEVAAQQVAALYRLTA